MFREYLSVDGEKYKLIRGGCGASIGIFKVLKSKDQFLTEIPHERGYRKVARAAISAINAIEKAKISSLSQPTHEQQLAVA